jgi:hypothetical protein
MADVPTASVFYRKLPEEVQTLATLKQILV